ncbi:kinase-like domain-containing protein, partial [Microdochium bolleyi]
GQKFVIKELLKNMFNLQNDLQARVSSSPHVRTRTDTFQDADMFVYPYAKTDLLQISQKALTGEQRRDMLESALSGLCDLHDKDIYHSGKTPCTDIKPNNIVVDYNENTAGRIEIKNVQIADLEDAIILPPGHCTHLRCGNQLWRSPESWARAAQQPASDLFSFAIVMIYVMLNHMVFYVGQDKLKAPDSWRHIFWRHVSYFGDKEGYVGFLDYIGDSKDNAFAERLLNVENQGEFPPDGCGPRQPFSTWEGVNPDFKDLVGKMTSLDPRRRITAREALGHRWFDTAEMLPGPRDPLR